MGGRIPLHFGPAERMLFGWYHEPQLSAKTRDLGVIICNTLGNESLRLPRSLRHAAERLSAQGFPVLRFDFSGTGDSAGEDSDVDQLPGWLQDILLAIQELRKISGVNRISLMGVRIGAVLAAKLASDLGGVVDLILWEPFVTGKTYLSETGRQHKILISLSPSAFTFESAVRSPSGKEILGFFINPATWSSLENLDLAALSRRPAENVLVLGAQASAGAFQKALDHFDELGAKTEYLQAVGYQSIFREALFSEVPFAVLDQIVDWLSEKTGWRDTSLKSDSEKDTRDKPSQETQPQEAPVFFGEEKDLFGILTPAEQGPAKQAVIIINAGVGTRIGPHRLYVQMARAWAKLGFAVFRVDLSGSGDSVAGTGEQESNPYPTTAVKDVIAAMDYLKEKHAVEKFVVAGICSGADIAFRAAAEDSRVSGAVVINPRSFCEYNFPELELHVRAARLETTLISGKNWIKLVKSGTGSVTRVYQVGRSALFKLKQIASKNFQLETESIFPVKDVPESFQKILKRGANVLLAVSDGDPGMEYVEIHFPKEMRVIERLPGYQRMRIQGTDHLFTLKAAREAVLAMVTQYLEKTFR